LLQKHDEILSAHIVEAYVLGKTRQNLVEVRLLQINVMSSVGLLHGRRGLLLHSIERRQLVHRQNLALGLLVLV